MFEEPHNVRGKSQYYWKMRVENQVSLAQSITAFATAGDARLLFFFFFYKDRELPQLLPILPLLLLGTRSWWCAFFPEVHKELMKSWRAPFCHNTLQQFLCSHHPWQWSSEGIYGGSPGVESDCSAFAQKMPPHEGAVRDSHLEHINYLILFLQELILLLDKLYLLCTPWLSY